MAKVRRYPYPKPRVFNWSEEPTASITYDSAHDYLTVRFGEVRPGGYTRIGMDFWVGCDSETREVIGLNIFDLEFAVLKEHSELADEWRAIRPSGNFEKREDAAAAAFAHRLQSIAKKLESEQMAAMVASAGNPLPKYDGLLIINPTEEVKGGWDTDMEGAKQNGKSVIGPYLWVDEPSEAAIAYNSFFDTLLVRFANVGECAFHRVCPELWVGYDPETYEVMGLNFEGFEKTILREHPELAGEWLPIKEAVSQRGGSESKATASYARRLQPLAQQFVEEQSAARTAAAQAAAAHGD